MYYSRITKHELGISGWVQIYHLRVGYWHTWKKVRVRRVHRCMVCGEKKNKGQDMWRPIEGSASKGMIAFVIAV